MDATISKPAEPWWVAFKVEVEIGDRINSPDSGVKMVGLRLTPIRSDLLVSSLDLDAEGGLRFALDPVQAEALCRQLKEGAMDRSPRSLSDSGRKQPICWKIAADW